MDVRSYESGQDKKWNNKGDNESGGNRKERPGKQVEVVWACDEKRDALLNAGRRAMEMKVYLHTREKEERKT